MGDVSSEHIGTADLAKLLEESRFRTESSIDARAVHPHFAACPSCRKQFEGLSSLDRQLKSMTSAESATRRDACPGPDVWREIAGGLTPPRETLNFLAHASRCDHCGPLLRAAVAELTALNGSVSEAEQKHLAALESIRAEWQRSLARRITATSDLGSVPSWQRWLSLPRVAITAACFLILFGVASWIAIQRNQPAAAQHLLASAYTEKRTLELRIDGANYAPIRISRGAAISFTSRPEPLLKAESLIAAQLQSHPSDPAWLRAKAQADVLEGKYKAAVEALQHALQLDPGSPTLLTDLATADFQRALEEDRQEDFGVAFEYLSQTLKRHPDDPVALFNRAIVSEHQFLYQQALDDWDHYLRIDSTSQWAGEARSRANAVREKLNHHQSYASPLLSPGQVAEKLAADANPASEVDPRIEEYLHEAVTSWLPQAFPEAGSNRAAVSPDPSAGKALFFLANLTTQQHNDHWLADLLRGSSAPHFPQAANALARGLKAHDAGDDDLSLQQARLSEQLFRASGNAAGVLRAQLEKIFAEQMKRHSEGCRREATTALAASQKYPYSWLRIQLGLEEAVCSGLMSDMGTDESLAKHAMDQARRDNYDALYLRALGFVAGDKFEGGDETGGTKLTNAGLDSYWSAQYPPMRGYNLYTELAYSSETIRRPAYRAAIWREAIAVIDSDDNLLLRAKAHSYMADAATAANLPQAAKQQYAEAAHLFAAAPHTVVSHNHALEAEVRTAQLEAQQGLFDEAITRLTHIQDQVRPLSNNYLVQIFYSTLGELQLGRHRYAEAEQALRPALALSEQSLLTLGSEAERASWSEDAAPAYLALVEAQLAQGRSQQALQTYEWYLGASQRTPTDPTSEFLKSSPGSGPSPMASRFHLLARETVLTYATLPDGLAIWARDNRGINVRWIPQSNDSLQELAERFHNLSADPGSEMSALRRDSHSLYDALVAPIDQYLVPDRTLMIEADGWLTHVPFEALLDSHNRYLIERVPIVYSLGQASEARLRGDTGISAEASALVVASTASSSADGLIPLPDVAVEADLVAKHFHSARELEGRQVTFNALKSAMPEAALFHFAGHSLATPDKAGLMLANANGQTGIHLLDADHLQDIKLPNLQLAMLSACNTSEDSRAVSGFNSVSQAFLRAGVPHVVASRWAIDSTESRALVEDFYSNLLSGAPVSESIRMTSRKMMSHPQTSHPYYWSAFAAYGKP